MIISTIRRILLVASFIAVCAWSIMSVRGFLLKDPLARYRFNNESAERDRIAVVLKDVDLRQYKGTVLDSRVIVKKVDIPKDKQAIEFTKIVDGALYEKDGEIRFTAEKGRWDPDHSLLMVSNGARLYNKDMDLVMREFSYDDKVNTLTIPEQIRGKLFDGDVEAYHLVYQTAVDSYNVGPITWTGDLEAAEKATQNRGTFKLAAASTAPTNVQKVPAPLTQSGRKRWTIKAIGASRPPGDTETWIKGEATDGEILVKADKIERNTKTDVLVALGNVHYYSKDLNAICDKATIFKGEKRAIMENNIQAMLKPKEEAKLEVVEITPIKPLAPEEIPKTYNTAKSTEAEKELDREIHSTETARKYPVILWAQRIESWYGDGQRRSIISGAPQARQKLSGNRWRHIWTNTAYYDREKEMLRLVSSPNKKDTRVRTSLGDDMRAKWFLTSTREGVDAWEGEGIEGDIFTEQEDQDENKDSEKAGKAQEAKSKEDKKTSLRE